MAFRDIASTSAASTSSSSTKPCYDVFINHRGKDTKHTLASSIYNTLGLVGAKAFLDQEELEVGDSFPFAIEEAMRSASVHIAIFSPSYAESPWCLEELSFMLRINVTIIPVFYHVDPSDLRYVTKGKYADAFRQHERKRQLGGECRYKPEKIKEWEEALGQVSYLSGHVVDGDNCDEGKLLRKIVEIAIEKMKKVPLEFARSPIGLDKAVEDFECKVGSSINNENPHIVGIVGMGGAGKTTLAKELYNRKCSSISRSCFLFNVRDAASTNTFHKLQEKLLMAFGIQYPQFDNKNEGMGMLARISRSMVGLIVLDDVDDVDQMEALLPDGMIHNLGQGSFIIVTTREVDVLTSSGISCIYHMKLLNNYNAKQLFCRHAFLKNSQPTLANLPDNFEVLIERFVKACNGLPLSLKVLGAMMNGKSKAYWESQLNKMSRILPTKIVDCLKISYDALDPEEQQMFLDVACFFIGAQKSLAVAIWDGSGWSGEVGWETLVNKCLIGLDEENRINMHDHLRDLGRQIAEEISQPSRIWKEEQISNQGALIRGILHGLNWINHGSLSLIRQQPLEHFMEKMINRPSSPELQLLAVEGNDFREQFAALSRDLVFLRWRDFNGTNFPSWLSLANLTVLQLYDATKLEELWQENVQPPLQLRELIIEGTCLQGLPRSIGRLRHLKKIVLNGGYGGMRMRSLPEEFCDLESLELLELGNFPVLSSLPHDFGKLINLRTLKFCVVHELTALPASFKQLKALQTLEIIHSNSFRLSSEMLDVLEFMTQLQVLSIEDCPQLEESPHLTNQISLRELQLYNTGLREVPNNMDQLTKLQTLTIGSPNLTSLPESLGALACLTSLTIWECHRLECLPEALRRLSNLQELAIHRTLMVEIGFLGIGSPSGCNLNTLKSLVLEETGVRRISISDDCCPTLQTLELVENHHLTEIETLPGNVRRIRVVSCHKLKSIRGIGGLLNLERLEVKDCWELEEVECGAYMNSVGQRVRIRDCPNADGNVSDYDYSESDESDDDVGHTIRITHCPKAVVK